MKVGPGSKMRWQVIRKPTPMQYIRPLTVDTNQVYDLDMSRFPGWDDYNQRKEQALMIHQPQVLCSCSLPSPIPKEQEEECILPDIDLLCYEDEEVFQDLVDTTDDLSSVGSEFSILDAFLSTSRTSSSFNESSSYIDSSDFQDPSVHSTYQTSVSSWDVDLLTKFLYDPYICGGVAPSPPDPMISCHDQRNIEAVISKVNPSVSHAFVSYTDMLSRFEPPLSSSYATCEQLNAYPQCTTCEQLNVNPNCTISANTRKDPAIIQLAAPVVENGDPVTPHTNGVSISTDNKGPTQTPVTTPSADRKMNNCSSEPVTNEEEESVLSDENVCEKPDSSHPAANLSSNSNQLTAGKPEMDKTTSNDTIQEGKNSESHVCANDSSSPSKDVGTPKQELQSPNTSPAYRMRTRSMTKSSRKRRTSCFCECENSTADCHTSKVKKITTKATPRRSPRKKTVLKRNLVKDLSQNDQYTDEEVASLGKNLVLSEKLKTSCHLALVNEEFMDSHDGR